MVEAAENRPADATGNWIDRRAPPWARPYVQLARFDRPIGGWLLLWPCWWSLALAAGAGRGGWPDPGLLLLFGLGAFLMRGAGCTFNDIADRDFDARVERTRNRPLPSGTVSLTGAVLFMAALALASLAILLRFNDFAVLLGLAALPVVAVYPFMKRLTHWPQIVLGLAFNWGALLGWAAVTGGLAAAPLALYAGGIAWTLVYDTIYAHQDKDDDAVIGVRSTALRLGPKSRPWLVAFAGLAVAGTGAAGWLVELAWPFYAGLAAAAAHLAWQVSSVHLDDGADCLTKFRSNREFGLIVFVALVAGSAAA